MTEGSKGWQKLVEELARAPEAKYATGPWNGSYLPPYSRSTDRLSLEPIAPRITMLDYGAYMSSIDHIRRSYGTGHFPSPDITLDDASLDTHECWNQFGRGTAFLYAALNPERNEELGCAYLTPTIGGAGAYETSLQFWVVERAIRSDLDRHLLQTMLSWIEEEWEFDAVLHVVPQRYERGIEVALEAGLRSVERDDQPPEYACFTWDRTGA
jgi:hypothetical protein